MLNSICATMNNKELKRLLQSKALKAQLTSLIDFELDTANKILVMRITKRGMESNMQTDEGAFESWAIVLKYYLSDIISTVTICWEAQEIDERHPHITQFYYRLNKFRETYPWIRITQSIPEIPKVLLCNCPTKECASKDHYHEGSEGELECDYVAENRSKYDCIDRQLPMGLFRDVISQETHFSPGNKSAIDIWAIKGNDFYLFELKKQKNKPLGILSEIMYYTNVINDLLSHRINYERPEDSIKVKAALNNDYRSFCEFYNNAYLKESTRKLNAVLLSDEIHPLITDGLLDFVNESPRWNSLNIKFSWKSISSSTSMGC